MSYLDEYFEYCKDANSADSFTLLSYDYLDQNDVEISLFTHNLKLKPVEIIKSNESSTKGKYNESPQVILASTT